MRIKDIKKKIRVIKNFPKKGVLFRDITPLLQDPYIRNYVILEIQNHFKDKKINVIASAESRGFIFGAILAERFFCSFIPLRKPGKLPYKTLRCDFKTEYSIDGFEIHQDAIKREDNVLIVDDLLATGGTAEAAIKLIEKLKGKVVGLAFLIELSNLKGREKLKKYDIFSLIKYN